MRVHGLIRRRSRLVAALVVAACSIAGCSSDKSVPQRPASEVRAGSLVSQADIDATRPGGPSRTIMMWWQFTQYRVVNDGLALFTPEAQRQLKRAGYANFVPAYLGPWLRNGKPQVQRVALPDPKHATVYMQTTFVAPVSTDVVRKNEDVLAFTLEQRKGKWLLSDPSWFIAQANTLRTAAERPPAPAPRAQG